MNYKKSILFIVLILNFLSFLNAQEIPKIIFDKETITKNYMPNFSYAGVQFWEKEILVTTGKVILATDYGVITNDSLDDSKNLIKAINAANKVVGNVILQLPVGRIILSEIIHIERSNFVLRGAGPGKMGSEIYFPRPLMYAKDPKSLQELREYLIKFDKRQREKENNIDLSFSFSQYAWSGGFIWTRIPGIFASNCKN